MNKVQPPTLNINHWPKYSKTLRNVIFRWRPDACVCARAYVLDYYQFLKPR